MSVGDVRDVRRIHALNHERDRIREVVIISTLQYLLGLFDERETLALPK